MAIWPTGEAIGDTLALRDGTRLEGIIGNREILASTPYAFENVAILVEETGEYRVVPVSEILYILLVDGDVTRLIDVRDRPVEKAPAVTEPAGVSPWSRVHYSPRVTLKVGLGASFLVPPSDHGREWNAGWSGSARLGFPVNPAASFNIGLEYNRFGVQSATFTWWGSGVFVDGGSLSVLYLPLEVQMRPPDTLGYLPGPYIVLGGGYYRVDIEDAWVSVAGQQHKIDGESEDALGFHFGAGITARRWFVEGLGVYGMTEGSPTGHWAIRAGVQVEGSSFGHGSRRSVGAGL